MTTSPGTPIHTQARPINGLPVRFARRAAPVPGKPVPSPPGTSAAARMATPRPNVDHARCEALFAAALQRSDAPAAESVAAAISRAVRRFGTRGCASRMAQEFGDHPQAAAERMRWARQLAAGAPAPAASGPGAASAAKYVADNGRIIYVSSSTTGCPMPGYALHGGSKVAPQYLVQVLAHEVGARGIAVNAIVPTATEGAGLHTDVQDDAPIRKFVAGFTPMGRMGTPDDVADAAEFFASELSSGCRTRWHAADRCPGRVAGVWSKDGMDP